MNTQQNLDRRTTRGRELAQRLNRETAIKATRFFVIEDDYNQAYRIWQSCGSGNVFDLVPYKGSETLVAWWKRHPSMFIFADPEDYKD